MNPKESGIVDLEDLPETDWLYFDKRCILKKILDLIVQLHFKDVKNKYSALSNLTGFSQHFVSKLYLSSRNKIKIAREEGLVSIGSYNGKAYCYVVEK